MKEATRKKSRAKIWQLDCFSFTDQNVQVQCDVDETGVDVSWQIRYRRTSNVVDASLPGNAGKKLPAEERL